MTTPAGGSGRSRPAVAVDIAAFLEGMPLFEGLTAEQVAKIVAICRLADVKAGTAIVREGERGDTMYVLVEGRVEVSRTLSLRLATGGIGESEKSFTQLEAKDRVLFGEMALLEQSERAATVVALTDCHLLEIRHDDFERLCRQDAGLGYIIFRNMARQLSARLRRTNQDVLKLTTALSLALGR